MDAIKVALETILVGALTLPVLYLALELLVPDSEPRTKWLKEAFSTTKLESLVTVLCFVAAYVLGALVSRIAEDFFNDDDNIIMITEDAIHANAYCSEQEPWPISAIVSPVNGKQLCSPPPRPRPIADSQNEIVHIFRIAESSVLLLGEEKTDKIHLLHQQIMVLRGAAFDGLLASTLCLFGWLAGRQGRRFWIVFPAALIIYVIYMLYGHFRYSRYDAPSMEVTWLFLAVGGCYVLWKGAQGEQLPYGRILIVALLATVMASLGWWRAEVVYNQVVLRSFYAQNHVLQKLAP